MGKLMVKSQFNLCWSWLTSKDGWPPRMWKMVSPMNCRVFKPQDLNPGQSSKCNVANSQQQPMIRFPVIWSDLFCLFPWQKSGTHKMTYPSSIPWGPPPADAISDHPLGLHPSRAVVQICKGGLRRRSCSCSSCSLGWAKIRHCEKHRVKCERFIRIYKVYILFKVGKKNNQNAESSEKMI